MTSLFASFVCPNLSLPLCQIDLINKLEAGLTMMCNWLVLNDPTVFVLAVQSQPMHLSFTTAPHPIHHIIQSTFHVYITNIIISPKYHDNSYPDKYTDTCQVYVFIRHKHYTVCAQTVRGLNFCGWRISQFLRFLFSRMLRSPILSEDL